MKRLTIINVAYPLATVSRNAVGGADSAREMADAIHAAAGLDRERSRESARHRFSLRRMCEQYLDLYRTLASGRVSGTDRRAPAAALGGPGKEDSYAA